MIYEVIFPAVPCSREKPLNRTSHSDIIVKRAALV